MQVTDVLDVTDVTKHLTKNQILEERDFQAMYGLARDVEGASRFCKLSFETTAV